ALDEIITLDPDLPELGELTARFDDLRRTAAASPRGPRLAAAAVFVITVLGASWLPDSTALFSRPIMAAAPLVPPVPLLTPLVTVTEEFAMAATAAEREAMSDPSTPDVPEAAAPAPRPPAEPEIAAPPAVVADVPVRPVVHESI